MRAEPAAPPRGTALGFHPQNRPLEPLTFEATTTRAAALARLRTAMPALDARLLLLDALGVEPAALVLEPVRPLGAEAARALTEAARRRMGGEPVSRILGEREFWGLPFALSPATLVPRPDTETVVEAALALAPDHGGARRLLDLGTGSGCLLVALLHEWPGAWGLGVDRSREALRTARGNAARNGVAARAAFAASDWGRAVDARFDLVVSNPPYIATGHLAGLAPEVRDYDPAPALDGGPDGLDAYRAILADAGRLLAPGGALVLEIGYDQGESVPELARALGWRHERTRPDLAGHPRAVTLRPA